MGSNRKYYPALKTERIEVKQHRPERESQKAQEVADLKREVGRLTRQNASLRRRMEKAVASKDAFEGCDRAHSMPIETVPLTPEVLQDAHNRMIANFGAPQTRMIPKGTCPVEGCNGALRRVDLGRLVIDVCPNCKYKHKVT